MALLKQALSIFKSTYVSQLLCMKMLQVYGDKNEITSSSFTKMAVLNEYVVQLKVLHTPMIF